jgi:hypothetical protein
MVRRKENGEKRERKWTPAEYDPTVLSACEAEGFIGLEIMSAEDAAGYIVKGCVR